jgi:FkbM family methyltransferase
MGGTAKLYSWKTLGRMRFKGMTSLMQRMKFFLSQVVIGNPLTLYLAWIIVPRLTFLLPHDRAFYGFRHYAKGVSLDIGANNGISSRSLHKIRPDMKIVAIEANPMHEPNLRAVGNAIPNFTYHIMGAGNTETRLTFYTPKYRGLPLHANTSTNVEYIEKALARILSEGARKKIEYDTHEIDVKPLDQLELNPSIIKIDTEGFDLIVLEGLTETLKKHRPVIMFEYNPELGPGLNTFFDGLSYDLFLYDHLKDTFESFSLSDATDLWKDETLNINPFAVPQENASTLPQSAN